MKFILTILILTLSTMLFGQDNYVLHINDTVFDLTLDKEYQLKVNNELVSIKLKSKDTLSHDDVLFNFKYPGDYKVSKLTVEDGIDQVMIMTAGGSGILIQQYTKINPSMLTGMMMNEVIKESINYGFEKESEYYDLELKSGQTMKVEKAILTYKGASNIYEIASIGNKEEGILIMTMRMLGMSDVEGQRIIDLMWSSLEYK